MGWWGSSGSPASLRPSWKNTCSCVRHCWSFFSELHRHVTPVFFLSWFFLFFFFLPGWLWGFLELSSLCFCLCEKHSQREECNEEEASRGLSNGGFTNWHLDCSLLQKCHFWLFLCRLLVFFRFCHFWAFYLLRYNWKENIMQVAGE